MWLIDTKTFQLHRFASPEAVKEGYVILSHVWDEEEMSFQDLNEILRNCGIKNLLPSWKPKHRVSPVQLDGSIEEEVSPSRR